MSYWLRDAADAVAPSTTALAPCDVAIVGGGIAGVSVAFWLRRMGYTGSVTIVDSRGVARGASGRNGGHLWPESGSEFEERCAAAVEDVARELGVKTHMHGAERSYRYCLPVD